MVRALVDTGALLALASPRDQFHERAVGVARRFARQGGQWLGSVLVLGEFHGHVLHRRGPREARELLGALLNDPAHRWLAVDADLVGSAASAWTGAPA